MFAFPITPNTFYNRKSDSEDEVKKKNKKAFPGS